MTQIILPNQNITGPNLWSQVEDNDVAIRDVVNGDLGADNLQTGLLPPTGSILQYAGGAAPTGWLLCRGQEVSRTGTYAALFGVVGTAYGVGDGSTTFNLPDLQGRIPVGLGTHASVDALGDNDGTSTVANRRPAHSHTVSTDGAHTHTGTTDSAGSHTHTVSYGLSGGFSTSQRSATGTDGNDNQSTTTSSNGAHTHTFTTASGGSHTHTVGSTGGTNDAPSFVVVNYIIKV